MRDSAQAFLLTYDIREPKRLQRVHKFLVEEGLAVQYSVFAGAWTQGDYRRVELGIRTWIEWRDDDVRVYPVPDQCRAVLLGPSGGDLGVDLRPSGLDLFGELGRDAAGGILRRRREVDEAEVPARREM